MSAVPYRPLQPAPLGFVPPLDMAKQVAESALERYAKHNVHDKSEMTRAAVGLHVALGQLLAALDVYQDGSS